VDQVYKQAAVIPFRLKNKAIEILLITSINSGRWIFPKGIIDEGFTAEQAAANEAFEEAGIEGTVLDILIGNYQYQKWGGICDVRVFPMYVQNEYDDWPESKKRQRCWVSQNKARKLIKKKELKILLTKFAEILNILGDNYTPNIQFKD
jgi:phosphohistidine phosphatase